MVGKGAASGKPGVRTDLSAFSERGVPRVRAAAAGVTAIASEAAGWTAVCRPAVDCREDDFQGGGLLAAALSDAPVWEGGAPAGDVLVDDVPAGAGGR